MMAKRLFVLLVAAIFSLGIASTGLAVGMEESIRGTVTKIEGSSLTIRDFMGVEKTVEPKNPEALTDIKVGDRATLKDGILSKDEGASPSGSSPPAGSTHPHGSETPSGTRY
jgi:hypothetical protein